MRYMKKWHLEFNLPDGRRWSGFINTMADNIEDFPKFIKGIFYTECIKNKGHYGQFILNTGEKDSVISIGMLGPIVNPKFKTIEEWTKWYNAETEYLEEWERIEMKIEDCLDLENTYILDRIENKFISA